MQAPKSLRELLLAHELIFIALITLAVASGGYGIYIWDRAAKESQRIHLLVQEIQETRSHLYRQMKELFDGFFLEDNNARNEYKAYTISVLGHFKQLQRLAVGKEEQQAIADLEREYRGFVSDAPDAFYRYRAAPSLQSRKSIYYDMEAGIFARYEGVSQHAEQLLQVKQQELQARLLESKRISFFVLSIPIVLAGLLLVFSRYFLKRNIIKPINEIMRATSEISAGNLAHKLPETGAAELATLSQEINKMAEDLADSRDALVRTEKQAALGLLVPMLAHNIRNPLASIRATAQVVDVPAHDKDGQDSLKGIISTVDRLERWIGSLLAYLLPTKPRLNVADFGTIVQGAIAPLQEKVLEKNISLSLQIAQVSAPILTDEHLLEQALYNLLLNAIEASPNQSTITLNAKLENQILAIEIIDQGTGMPFTPDPHAISPGPSTKRFGTGLGIPFAFKVCEVLGGSIAFSPAHPNGTHVSLHFPQ